MVHAEKGIIMQLSTEIERLQLEIANLEQYIQYLQNRNETLLIKYLTLDAALRARQQRDRK